MKKVTAPMVLYATGTPSVKKSFGRPSISSCPAKMSIAPTKNPILMSEILSNQGSLLKKFIIFLLKKSSDKGIEKLVNEQMRKWAENFFKVCKIHFIFFLLREKLLEYKKHVIRKEEATFQTQREKINKWV